jgi:hypothetical protein
MALYSKKLSLIKIYKTKKFKNLNNEMLKLS